MEKLLFILRHVSGAGSSTLAKFLIKNLNCSSSHYEADFWMEKDGKYEFSPTKLGFAHNSCKRAVELDMAKNISFICVSNTFTRESEIEPYILLAKQYGYNYTSLVVENRNDTKSIHSVPQETLLRQEINLKYSLKLI